MHNATPLDDLPAPGEPLTPKIAEENQALLDEELAERVRRFKARLTFWERWKLKRRKADLERQLIRANYNDRVLERYQLWQLCSRLKHERAIATHPARCQKLKAELIEAVHQGLAVDARLAPLKPLADEYESIRRRLKAHDELIDWEKEEAENTAAFKREAVTWEQQLNAVFKQSPRLHHKGIDKKGRDFIRIPKIQRIVFKDDRVLYQIQLSKQSVFQRVFGRWSYGLPYGVDIDNLTCEESVENYSAACNRVVSIERAKVGTNLYLCINRLDSPDGLPRRVLFNNCMDWYPIQDHSKTPWAAGVTDERKVVWFNFEDYPNILIAGAPGGGKSNHTNSMIATIAIMNNPSQVKMVMIDLKGGIEYSHWNGLNHLMGNIVKTPGNVLEALRAVRELMENRLAIFESVKAKKLSAYNQRFTEQMPRIIVFVDELATLVGLGQLTTDIHTELRVLSSQGRAAGVHMVLATQHPSVDVLPGWIKTNMNIRIASKMPTQIASQIILDTGTAALLPVISGRMVFSIGRNEIIAQSPYISDAEIVRAVEVSHTHVYHEPVEEQEIEEPVEIKAKFGEKDVIQIALDHLEGKLKRDRILEIAGKGRVTEWQLRSMIQGLISAKTYSHDGKTYEITKVGRFYVVTPSGEQEADYHSGDMPDLPPGASPNKFIPEFAPDIQDEENEFTYETEGAFA